MHLRRPDRIIAAGVLAVGLAISTASPAAAVEIDQVADGFAGPLGLAIGPDGTVYVAQVFLGTLTAIDRDGDRTDLVTGEPVAGGVEALGRKQVVYTTRVGEPGVPPSEASLMRVTPAGKTRQLASLLAYEAAENPDATNLYGFVDLDPACAAEVDAIFGGQVATSPYPGQVDSNPYAVAFDRGGYVVADAGGNDIVRVDSNGRVSTVAVLPPIDTTIGPQVVEEFGAPECVVGAAYRAEPVPTDVEVGPDGSYYVSSLPGFPEAPGTGSVFRVTRSGSVDLVATGFSGAVDLAVTEEGTIYVAELFGGQISQIVDGDASVLVEVTEPAAVEVAPDGTLYATTDAFGNGRVVIVTP
jgi:sugar lactone lactonase YvrE